MKFISVPIDLLPEDIALMVRMRDLMAKGTPKRRAVVRVPGENYDAEKRKQHTFERLKLLGLVIHRPDGHCWLSDQAKQIVATAEAG